MKKQLWLGTLFSIQLSLLPFADAAELLYQWKEADGSLTFSPTPPPKGSNIEYEVVKSTDNRSASPKLTSSAAFSSSTNLTATPEPAIAEASVLAESSINRLSYTPVAVGQREQDPADLVAGLSPATSVHALPSTDAIAGQPSLNQASAASRESVPAATKRHHCGKLQKRIMSLETIMAGSRDAKTMDDTVVQISRYQSSFNQHCKN